MEMPSDRANEARQVTGKKGGLKTIPFIIANEILVKVAGYGLLPNMILFLIYKYHFSAASTANVLFLWLAISNFMPTVGAFLSDSCLGRFHVIGSASVISLGMTLLWLTTLLQDARPLPCNLRSKTCEFLFALMSIGAGGIRPCSLAFGADQINNPDGPPEWANLADVLQLVLRVSWGFDRDPCNCDSCHPELARLSDRVRGPSRALCSLYVKVKVNKSLFAGLAQSIVAAWKERHLELPSMGHDATFNHHHEGSKVNTPSKKLRFLNEACLINCPEKDLDPDGLAIDPWSLRMIKQVEELKAPIKVLPIWPASIMIGVTMSQGAFTFLQATTLDRRFLFGIEIAPGSFGIFSFLTLTLWVAVSNRIAIPLISKLTKQPGGLTFKERMGIGLLISCAGMCVSATVENKQRAKVILEGFAENPVGVLKMSAMWIVPQQCLSGLAEAFNAIGQLEFYYSRFPKSMASIAVALLTLVIGVGNGVASLIVSILDHLSKRSGNGTWISTNVNEGRDDYYYWVLAALSVINFFYYLVCAWGYGSCEERNWDEDELEEDQESHQGSPMRILA